MGNTNAGGATTLSGAYARQRALETWLCDIGVLSRLPMASDDDRWPDDWIPNDAADVGRQFSMLPRAFALCGCDVHVESMRLDWPDRPALPEAFRRAVADVAARGELRRCVDRCRQRRCVVPLAWWWDPALDPETQSEHLTLLVLDRVRRAQWFFDPSHPEDHPDRPLTDWMETAALVPGYRPRAVRYAREGRSLQGFLEGDGDCGGGACTGVSLLFTVALWRFGAPDPWVLLDALVNCLEDVGGNPHHRRLMRRRLIRWQHAVTHVTDRRRLFRLFGLADPVGDVTARPCAAFVGGDAGICRTRCAILYDDRDDPARTTHLTLCRAHAAELIVPAVLSFTFGPTTGPSVLRTSGAAAHGRPRPRPRPRPRRAQNHAKRRRRPSAVARRRGSAGSRRS